MSEKICDVCHGEGETLVTGFFNPGGYKENVPMKCGFCFGTGKTCDGQLWQRRIGFWFKQGLHDLDLTTREASKILGWTATEVSDLMQGRYGFRQKAD